MEKSGIQLLQEISNQLKLLDKRMIVIEENQKHLLNRANILSKGPIITTTQQQPKNNIIDGLQTNKKTPRIVATVPTPALPPEPEYPIGKAPNGTSKAIGKILDKNGRLLGGVNIKIFDKNNQMVKQTKTNRAGEWVSFLPEGVYKAEYFLENIIDTSVLFSVTSGQEVIRVAQPQ